MIATLKKYWWIALGLVLLCFFLWKGCKPGPDHSGDKTSVDSVNAAFAVREKVLITRNDSLGKINQAKDVVIAALLSEKANMQRDLSQRGKAIDQTIQSGKEDRAKKDTQAIVSNCDSLVSQVEMAKAEVGGYQSLTDTLIGQLQAQAITKDALISNWRDLFLHADTAREITQDKYNSLYSDYVKVNRKLKFSGFMGKTGAVVIAALAVGLLIKK